MDFSKVKVGKWGKKLLPWHCQKRFQESLSELSLNHSILSARNEEKIKSLQKNNKFLALALQQSRSVITEKENLMVQNGKSMDIINFSKLKIMDLAEQIKNFSACLEETLSLLNLGISDGLPTHAHNINYRADFKNKLQEINIEPIEEVTEKISENTNSSNEQETSMNKSRLSKKNDSAVKRKGKHVKTSKVFCAKNLDSSSIINSANSNLRNSKKIGSIVQFQKKSISMVKNIRKESNYDLKLSPEISSIDHETKNVLNTSDKNETCVLLSEICKTFSNKKNIDQTVKYDEKINENMQKVSEMDTYSKKTKEAENTFLSTSNFSCHKLQKNINETQKCTGNTNYHINSGLCSRFDVPVTENRHEVAVQNENGDLMCDKINDKMEANKVEKNFNDCDKFREPFVGTGNNPKHNDNLSSKCRKRLYFYYDEESIETVKNKKAASIRKKKFAGRKRALQTITEMTDHNNTINEKGKPFVVTAEIHPIPDYICQDNLKKNIDTSNLQPSVVLTDIFKSRKSMISDIIRSSQSENDCIKEITHVKATGTGESFKENDSNAIYLNSESMGKEKFPLQSLLEKKECRRRARVVSYKEPSLNLKMRRCI
ncbi:shugoshin_C domain-containing protein [Nephila pilipes]|uniref:Shugoshin_C domain-containing protein n=1 Tax=Nephila pilipes TaxID=299642 RepID=A0A8X6MXI6_NEPPI|nr:shugoshin_C domain-containing protein [Nephila pilipes]